MFDGLGKRVRSLREALDLSQEKLAAVSGLSGGYIGQLEGGRMVNIGIETLARLAKALKVDLDFLLYGTVKESNVKTIETLQKFAEELGELNRHQKRIVSKLKKVEGTGNLKAVEQFLDNFTKH